MLGVPGCLHEFISATLSKAPVPRGLTALMIHQEWVYRAPAGKEDAQARLQPEPVNCVKELRGEPHSCFL